MITPSPRLPKMNELRDLAEDEHFDRSGMISLSSFSNFMNSPPVKGLLSPDLIDETIKNGGKTALITLTSTPVTIPAAIEASKSPGGTIAPFAASNFYLESVKRLKRIRAELINRSGYKKSDMRIFSNSGFPEKAMASMAGLGFIGKNSLLISGNLGSGLVISGIILPWYPEGFKEPLEPPDPPGTGCGSCDLCMSSCPTGAIISPGTIDRSRCLQALSTGEMPEEFFREWNTRIYGCQICQDICPHNCSTEINPSPASGSPGPEVPLETLLSLGADEIKKYFKGTTLDQAWIEGRFILRNALLAAGNHPKGAILAEKVEKYLTYGDSVISEAAEWALKRIKEKNNDY